MAKTYQQVILFTIILCVCRFQIRTKRIIWNCKRVQTKSNQKRILRNLHFCKGLQTFFLSSLECCCTCFQTQTLSSLPVVTLHVRKLGAWNSGVWVLHVGYSWTHSIKSCIHLDRSGLMHTAACIQLRAYSCAHTAARIQLHAYSCAHTAARIQLHAYSCAHTAESITVADLGFHEGGFVRWARLRAYENFCKPRPLPGKNHALLRSWTIPQVLS